MTYRSIKQLIRAMAVSEGAGVTVHRTIGTSALRNFDPFLMLDFFSSDDPDDYIAGFPDHPHRGFVTLTYMLEGHMLHQDSMGNKGDLQSGGAQWMKAASGVIHSEMPKQSAGLMRGFQLWINLPASEKMGIPEYQDFRPDAIPSIEENGANVKILSGCYKKVCGPIRDSLTGLLYFDVKIGKDQTFYHSYDQTLASFIYMFEGGATLDYNELPQHGFCVLDNGDSIELTAGSNGARFILVAGQPLQEPIVQYGPFVMNTQQEIQQAISEYQNGTLVRGKPHRTT